MLKAILYKEWIKLRWYALLAVLVTTGVAAYCLLRMDRAVTLRGAGHIWEVMVLKNAIFIDYLQFVPLLAGVLAALVQFMPEMQRKCLKLTLHLPCSQQRMVFTMLAAGVLVLVACFAVNVLVMLAYLTHGVARRSDSEYPFGCCPVVSRRVGRIPAHSLGLPGTDLACARGGTARGCTRRARLFPFGCASCL